MSKSLGEKSLTGIIWVAADKFGSGGINFLVNILLARLLAPDDFGLVTMVLVFYEISSAFVQSGFSAALVRQKEISEIDKSTTFIFNLVAAVVFYLILFVSAPAIAAFYAQAGLVLIVRVLALNLIISAFAVVQRATLTQRIDFKTLTKARLIGIFLSGGIGVYLAFQGFGVWALVAKMLSQSLIDTTTLWILNRWVPSLRFSWESFRRLFSFGSNILLAALLDKGFNNANKLIMGRFFAAAMLGYYTQATVFKNMVINNLFMTVQKVTYPVLAKLQDDKKRLKEGYRTFIKMTSFLVLPAMVIMGVLAESFLLVLVGEKWLPATPFLQLLCLAGVTYHFSVINLNVLLVLGRSDLSLRLEVIKKITIALAIIIGIQYGIYGLVIGEVVAAYINLGINTYYSERFLQYSLFDQIKDVLPTITFSGLIGGGLYLLDNGLFAQSLFHLLLGSGVAFGLFLSLHWLFRTSEMALIRKLIIPKTLGLISKQFG